MTTRFGIALVGIGPGAQPHLRSLHDLQELVELRHAITRRPGAADLGPFQGLLHASADLQAALADPAVQAVLIATPPASHLEIARQCFAHGKHVLLEKPLEISLERAQACSRQPPPLMIRARVAVAEPPLAVELAPTRPAPRCSA